MKRSFISIFGFLAVVCVVGRIAEAKDLTFPEVTGWKQSGEVQTFDPKTLYEYINGAADLYLAYDFEKLQIEEYQNEKKASVTIEVYRHKTPNDAFGIYSQERLPESSYLDVGTQGYSDKEVLNFFTGRYYVKITGYKIESGEQEAMLSFAKKVAENLGGKGAFPSALASFPAEGKMINSDKYIAKNFLGYAFLHSAFTADYELSGKKFRLFLMEVRDKNDCEVLLQKYLQQVKSPEREVTEGRHSLSDPHHGVVDLYWKGKHIWGVLDLGDSDLRSKYLDLFEEKIKEKKLKTKTKCLT